MAAAPPKVFVAGLNFATTEERVREFFGQAGEVVSATVLKDASSGNSRGIAHVAFRTAEEQHKAIDTLHERELDGRRIVVRAFTSAPPARTGGSSASGGGRFGPDENAVFVSGLSTDTTVDALKAHFAQSGDVIYAHIGRDRTTGQSKGLAKVAFRTAAARGLAVAGLDRSHLLGRTISVCEFAAGPSGHGDRDAGPAASDDSSNSNTVFIGGLHYDVTPDELRDEFAECGRIVLLQIMTDKDTGKSRGMAKIRFATAAEKDRAILDKCGAELRGRAVSVREFTAPGSLPRSAPSGRAGHPVSVVGLSRETTEASLRECFSACGVVLAATVLPDGEGKVTFAARSAMKRALNQLNGTILDGRLIELQDCDEGSNAEAEATAASVASPDYDLEEAFQPERVRPPLQPEQQNSDQCSSTTAASASSDAAPGQPQRETRMTRKGVLVTGLHRDTTSDELQAHFEGVGEIIFADILRDKDSMRSRGVGKVVFVNAEDRDLAIARLNRSLLGRKVIAVSAYTPVGQKDVGGAEPAAGADAVGEPWASQPRLAALEEERRPARPVFQGRRVDPEDGKAYSFGDFEVKCAREGFSAVETREYWEFDMTPAEEGADAAEGPPPRWLGLDLREWLEAVDGRLAQYAGALDENFDSVAQIMSLYAQVGATGRRELKDSFFSDVGIAKLAHKRIINKWVSENT